MVVFGRKKVNILFEKVNKISWLVLLVKINPSLLLTSHFLFHSIPSPFVCLVVCFFITIKNANIRQTFIFTDWVEGYHHIKSPIFMLIALLLGKSTIFKTKADAKYHHSNKSDNSTRKRNDMLVLMECENSVKVLRWFLAGWERGFRSWK